MDINGETEPLLAGEATEKEPLEERPERPRGLGYRHALTFWAFLVFINVFTMRVNLSVAMVAMVNSSTSSPVPSHNHTLPHAPPASLSPQCRHGGNGDGAGDGSWLFSEALGLGEGVNGTCPRPPGQENSTVDKPGEFNWDEKTRGNILGAFFYGCVLSQVPGGWLATRYGGKRVFGVGMLLTSVMTLLTPLAARTSVSMLILLRVLEGIGEGVAFPAMHSMWGVWAPKYERSQLAVFAYAGSDLGTVLALPISGLLCDSDIAGGWPSVFYVFGTLGVLWSICWMAFVYDTPSGHPWISEVEKTYIESSIGKACPASRPPWGKMASSGAVWAIIAGSVAQGWGLYVFLTCLPTYMKEILRFDIKTNASLSAIPYALSWMTKVTGGQMADIIRKNGYLSTKNTRKLFASLGEKENGCCLIGCFIPAALVLLVGVVGCNHAIAVLTLTLCVGFGGFVVPGFGVNHLDIAPSFSGILLAITNTFVTIPGFLSPLLVGALTNNNQTRHQWQIVFYITAAIYIIGASIYLILAQGEVLPWGGPSSAQDVGHESEAVQNLAPDTIEQDHADNSDDDVYQ